MSLLNIQTLSTNATVDIGDEREVVKGITTEYAKKIALSPFATLYNNALPQIFGGKVVGLGTKLDELSTEQRPGITSYLYSVTGLPVNPVTNLPYCIGADLEYDHTYITAFANRDKFFSDTNLKQGVINLIREPYALTLGAKAGQSYFWGPEQGLGYINTFAVTIEDIRFLKYKKESDMKVYSGLSAYGYNDEKEIPVTYYKNGIKGLTPSNAMLIAFNNDVNSLYAYDLLSGVYSKVTGYEKLPIMAIWGTQMYEVDDYVYFLGAVNGKVHLCRHRLETGEVTVGDEVADSFNLRGVSCGNLVRIGEEFFYSIPTDKSKIMSVSLQKVDIKALALTDAVVSYNIPVQMNFGHITVSTMPNEHLLLTDGVRGVSFEVENLQDFNTDKILRVYFTCSGICSTVAIGSTIYLIGYAKDALNSHYKYHAAILDADTSPLLGYGSTATTYNKTEKHTLSLTHTFEVI